MAEGSDKEDREIEASAQRLAKAREEGNVPRSRDVGHVLVLSAVTVTLFGVAGSWRTDLTRLLQTAFRFDGTVRRDFGPYWERLVAAMGNAWWPSLVVLVVAIVAGVAASAVPGGFNFATQALKFDVNRLNPASGFARIFSMRNLFEFGKSLVLAMVLGLIGVWFVDASFPEFGSLSLGQLNSGTTRAIEMVVGGLSLMLLVLVTIAVVDVPFQWFRHRKELMMTREEAKQEFKESEGDPHVKGRIKQKQREFAMNRMMAAVPTADVVVTNPTHYAVAIRYEQDGQGAPVVVAKGSDEVAMRIQALARESNVPLLEAPALARALWAHVRLEQEVPRELYAAVAQVLSYIFHLKRWVPGRGAAPRAPVGIPVPAHLDPHDPAAIRRAPEAGQ